MLFKGGLQDGLGPELNVTLVNRYSRIFLSSRLLYQNNLCASLSTGSNFIWRNAFFASPVMQHFLMWFCSNMSKICGSSEGPFLLHFEFYAFRFVGHTAKRFTSHCVSCQSLTRTGDIFNIRPPQSGLGLFSCWKSVQVVFDN